LFIWTITLEDRGWLGWKEYVGRCGSRALLLMEIGGFFPEAQQLSLFVEGSALD